MKADDYRGIARNRPRGRIGFNATQQRVATSGRDETSELADQSRRGTGAACGSTARKDAESYGSTAIRFGFVPGADAKTGSAASSRIFAEMESWPPSFVSAKFTVVLFKSHVANGAVKGDAMRTNNHTIVS